MKYRFFALCLVFVLAGLLFSACTPAPESAPAAAVAPEPEPAPAEAGQEKPVEDGIILTDMAGRDVRLDAPATRIVALVASDIEVLYAIGAGDLVVGRGEYCNYPPEVLEIQSVQSGNEANVEQIVELDPQLIIISEMAHDEALIGQFENAGVTVFVTDAQDIEGTYTAINSIGILTGKEEEAEAVVENMKSAFVDLHDKAIEAGGDYSIYFEVSPLEYGLWAAGDGTFMNEVAELLGMRNIFGDVTSWVEISEEQVLERNPDFILTVGMYFGDGPTPIESILSRPGWDSITAIKNEAILNLTADELSRPGPRLALGAQLLYEFVFEGGSATPSAD